jgi:hypothetical protein
MWVKCSLVAALYLNAHTRDEYQTKKGLLAFKLFLNEVVKQLEELQFTELKVVGLRVGDSPSRSQKTRGTVQAHIPQVYLQDREFYLVTPTGSNDHKPLPRTAKSSGVEG